MPAARNESIAGLAFFLVGIAAYFLLGVHAFVRVLGVGCVLTGLYWVLTRRIPVGIEGRPPSFHLRGVAAVALGVLMLAFGFLLAWFAPSAACLLGWSELSC